MLGKGIIMRIAILLTLALILTGCDDATFVHQEDIIAQEVSTKEELQTHCDALNALEKQKPFYKKKHVYEAIVGKYLKKGSGIGTISSRDGITITGNLFLFSDIKKIIYFGHAKKAAGKVSIKNKTYIEFSQKLSQKFSEVFNGYNGDFDDYLYGACAYKAERKTKSERKADRAKKRERYNGVIETLTRIEQE